MKRVLFIGDIHGKNSWKDIVLDAISKSQEIVFIGDYVDSFDIKPSEIIYNLNEIINLKIKYNNEITLLLGNHDYSYIHNHFFTSGFNVNFVFDYSNIFNKNKNLFKIAWGYTNPNTHKYTLATHAGITNKYYNKFIKPLINDKNSKLNLLTDNNANKLNIHEILNYLIDNDDLMWKVGPERGGSTFPSPLWADYNELLEDNYTGINQVFGHTGNDTASIDIINNDLLVKIDGHNKNCVEHIKLSL